MNTAHTVLESLRAGNRRFVASRTKIVPSQERRASLADGQAPSAIVLACADSRVPPELVFDLGLGELFVVRVAGNVCSPATLASIEYAASALGVSLVVVLGHTKCGAVKATLDAVKTGVSPGTAALDDLVARIAPAVSPLVGRGCGDPMSVATRVNAAYASEQLRAESPLLAERIARGKLEIVSAEYSLETGEVTFFETHLAAEAA